MPQPHSLKAIHKPDEETLYCYSVRRPFTASIYRRKKAVQKYQKGSTHRRKCECGYALKLDWNVCPKCSRSTTQPKYKSRKVWGNWKELKSKIVRSRKQAIKIAQRWYDGTPTGKEEKRLAEEKAFQEPVKVQFT